MKKNPTFYQRLIHERVLYAVQDYEEQQLKTSSPYKAIDEGELIRKLNETDGSKINANAIRKAIEYLAEDDDIWLEQDGVKLLIRTTPGIIRAVRAGVSTCDEFSNLEDDSI